MINLSRREDAILSHDLAFVARGPLRSVDRSSGREQGAHLVCAQSSHSLVVPLPPVQRGRTPRSSV